MHGANVEFIGSKVKIKKSRKRHQKQIARNKGQGTKGKKQITRDKKKIKPATPTLNFDYLINNGLIIFFPENASIRVHLKDQQWLNSTRVRRKKRCFVF